MMCLPFEFSSGVTLALIIIITKVDSMCVVKYLELQGLS
jgi:hypothetical protein